MPRVFAPNRRAVLAGGAALAATSLIGCGRGSSINAATGARLAETRLDSKGAMLAPAERSLQLGDRTGPTPAWLYAEKPFPVFRVRAGETFNATLRNGLKEHTSIHWHGVRVPNAMDGVPYVTQQPVQAGAAFEYSFAPPDPGTYFFHPHCNTAEQLGRGLSGVLVVEDAEPAPFNDDIVLVLKDWRVAPDGGFLPFLTLDGASHAGTFGTLRTVNGLAAPELTAPAGADVRLRIVNVDSTRVSEIGIDGADAAVIAIDGQAVTPFALEGWRLGPAMRLDVALRTPDAGGKIQLVDYFAAEPVTLATITAQGPAKRSASFAPPALKPPSLPEPNLARAVQHQMKLSESAVATDYSGLAPITLPDGTKIDLLDSLCSNARTLWAIDGRTWPQTGHEHLPPPLMTFQRGETASIELINTTPHVHPMHLHGHNFKVLSTSKLRRPVHWADTVLVMPDEHVQIAFVADNPGNWMIHCHIIEHQDTGMMAWFRVV
jgi:FtsP/CotA-like multicopper oxidase with cupredoxin domain